ncbi:MAG: helix-turn-helix transcriptional regulator [Burkholderiales bacterium]
MIQELGAAIRKGRIARGWTQARLAQAAGLSRNTVNRLENGLFPDLGVKKAEAILEKLGMQLVVEPQTGKAKQPDFIGMACTTASVSFKEVLAPDELVHALLLGKPTPGKEAHFVVLIEEAPAPLLSGLIQQVGKWAKAGKVEKNLAKIAGQLGVTIRGDLWPKTA